jgi:gliding motility-associated-like protein
VGNTSVTYIYTEAGCIFDTTINVLVNQRPLINGVYNNLGNNGYQFSQVCEGEELTNTYNTVSTGGINTWYVFGDTVNSQNLILTWDQPGFYNFYVIVEENGCFSLPYDYNVAIQDCPLELIYIPNTFTPDGDEFNQNFLPIMTEGFDPYDYNMIIFNRWGETVFESSNHLFGWDGSYNGKSCQEGTYIWRIEYGVPENDKRVVKHGHLTLIR